MSELNVAHKEELKQIESVLAQTRKEVLEKLAASSITLFLGRKITQHEEVPNYTHLEE